MGIFLNYSNRIRHSSKSPRGVIGNLFQTLYWYTQQNKNELNYKTFKNPLFFIFCLKPKARKIRKLQHFKSLRQRFLVQEEIFLTRCRDLLEILY